MLVYIGTKFGQNRFSSFGAMGMACDGRTDRQTAWARIMISICSSFNQEHNNEGEKTLDRSAVVQGEKNMFRKKSNPGPFSR